MSCRFLFFFLVIFVLTIQETFSSIHFSPDRNQIQYIFSRTNSNERVKRHTTSDIFRIHIHYDRSVQKYIFSSRYNSSKSYLFYID
jgi:hypothetical protein